MCPPRAGFRFSGAPIKRFIVLCASIALAFVLPSFGVQAGWKNVQIATGVYACRDDATGATFKPPYSSKSQVTASCNTLTSFIPWLGTADAAPISKALGANPNGTYDSANPCLDGATNCSAPTAASIAWTQSCLNTALAPQNSVIVGVAVDASVEACASGTNLAAATMSVVLASDGTTNCNATNLSITGSQPNRKLHNSATGAGTGTCKLKLTYMGASVISASFPWTNSTSGGSDTTPPTPVTGIVCTGGTLAATCMFDAQMDPDDGVIRSGVASYKVYSDLTFTDSLAAVSPGLTCDFTPQTIGAAVSGSPSATQGTGFSGAQWTVNARGYGTETADSYYGVSCPVSGTADYLITRVDSIAAGSTYNKAHTDIRNSTSTTAAHYDCVVMRQVIGGATTYYLQRTYRTADGGSNGTGATVALPGTPPYYVRASVVSNVGQCDYSTDGGAWTTVIGGDAITLNDSKIAVAGGSATSTGADDAAETVVFGSVAVQTAGRLSKTVTLAAGTHSLGIGVTDVTGNETGPVAYTSVTVAPSGAVTKKWNPGNYIQAHAAHGSYCGTACDGYRHGRYPVFLNEANVTGTVIWVVPKFLESDTGNDFTAGFAWLHAEINYIKTNYPGKKVGLLVYFGPYGQGTTQASMYQNFPNYFVDAGCVVQEVPTQNSLNSVIADTTCRGYLKRLFAAYGAEFDSEPALEFIRLDQETDNGYSGWSGASKDTGWKDLAASVAGSFPTTNVWVPMNWVGVETAANKESLLAYYKSINVGVGPPDTIATTTAPASYSCPSTWPTCVYRGLNTSIGGTSHDYCGEFVSFGSVELSEQGYNSVPGPITSAQVVASWNASNCAQYGIWDLNDNETGDANTMYWNGATGQKWAINNVVLTHSAKPAGYP
jgi:hypothetical protein